MTLVLGTIADDFTGATDLANTLVGEGMRVVQAIGVPGPNIDLSDADAVVVALKSRTAPTAAAVAQSRDAYAWLTERGARQVLFMYCSTFDSTADGNIGPVADALLDAAGTDFALVCPAFPAAGRTIYKGLLFVGDLPLAASSMKDHPLTPMRDSKLVRLMEAQSAHRAGLIPLEVVRQGPDAVAARIEALRSDGIRYGVADAVSDEDLRRLAPAVAGHRIVTGGSGIALGLPGNLGFEPDGAPPPCRRSLVER